MSLLGSVNRQTNCRQTIINASHRARSLRAFNVTIIYAAICRHCSAQ